MRKDSRKGSPPSSCIASQSITTHAPPGPPRPQCCTTRISSTRSPRRARSTDDHGGLTALALALGASIAWGVSDFVGPLVARALGSLRVLFWAQVGGLAAIVLAVAVRGAAPHDWLVLLAAPAALAGTLGLWAYYRGIAAGAISVVAPIAGASAVIPVVFGVATGDSPSVAQVAGIACALVGVVLASLERQEGSQRVAAGVGLALLAAVGFGCYFPPMHAAGAADPWWGSFVFRLSACAVVLVAVTAR